MQCSKEEYSWAAILRHSCPQIELSLEITENPQGNIQDAATFWKCFSNGQSIWTFDQFSKGLLVMPTVKFCR